MLLCPSLHERVRCGELAAVILLLLAVALLADVALMERSLFEWQFHRDWWGRTASGCWMVERLCVPGRSKDDGTLTIWQEWPADISEIGCKEVAQRYWRDCLDPTLGLVGALLPSGLALTRPAGAESYVGLHSALSVALSGGVQLLRPGQAAWTLKICSSSACRQLAASAFCDGHAEELNQGQMLPLRASCTEVNDGTWPQCGPESFQSTCAAMDVDAAMMRQSCESLCPMLQHAHNVFWLASVASVLVLVIVASFLIRGRWYRHSGCLTALLAVLGASAGLASIILLNLLDVSQAFAIAADAHQDDSGRQNHGGAAELLAASASLALAAFVVIGSSKDGQLLEYKLAEYERFNVGLRQATRAKQRSRQEKQREVGAFLQGGHAVAHASNGLEDQEGEPAGRAASHKKRPAMEAFQATGNEERIGYADGVLTRTSYDTSGTADAGGGQLGRQQPWRNAPLRSTSAAAGQATPSSAHSDMVGRPRFTNQSPMRTPTGPDGYHLAAHEPSRGTGQAWQDSTERDATESIDLEFLD